MALWILSGVMGSKILAGSATYVCDSPAPQMTGRSVASTSTIGRPLPLYAGVHQGRGAAHYLMLNSIEATYQMDPKC